MLKLLWKALVIAVMIALLLVLMPAPYAYADFIRLSLDEKAPPVDYSNYVSAEEYSDPSLDIRIWRGRYRSANYTCAVVSIADPLQIRSAFAGKASNGFTATAVNIAEAHNAVFAVNGDYFSSEFHEKNYIIRQGKAYKTRYLEKKWDLMIIDQNGDLHGIHEPSKEKLEAWAREHPGLKIINTFNMGPVLIDNGETVMADFNQALNQRNLGLHKNCARMAVCQLDPLIYLFVTCEGPDDEDGSGLTMNDFVSLLREVETQLDGRRIRFAYNLDGGASATMLFKAPDRNKLIRVNGSKSRPDRYVKDILFFVSAWENEEPASVEGE